MTKLGKKIIIKKRHSICNTNIKKVSVIIPNYNYENYILSRIDSILNQTYPIYELIILDDASTDNSVQVIKEKINTIKDIKVKFIENKKNSGCVFLQWKKGLSEATGDYVWIAEADDLSDSKFLETAMKGFSSDDIILSYTDSARIDENDILIRENSQDLYNIFNSNRWKSDYVNSGTDEVINYLSSINTIVNVSSTVWKNGNYSKILDEASNFKVAGDWYVYYKLLEMGNVAFCHQSLNYFRKHSKSVCTIVKDDIEYGEICRIQDDIAKKYNVGMSIFKWQRLRRNYMDSNVSSDLKKKKIAFVIPHPGKGSGGHRTIIQNVNALIKHGYECDIYVEEDYLSTDDIIAKKIDDYYEVCGANVYVGIKLRKEYDLLFATGWTTIDFVKNLECPKKAYFIQDFEPWFHPMGDNYLKTENSYHLGFIPVTIGKWLSQKMIKEYKSNSQYFDFCADLNVYKKLKNVKKENAICYIYQPEKPRRCDYIGLNALKIVKELRPDVKIYLFGSKAKANIDYDAEELGIIPIEKCNELYNKCKIGLCMSASNPSRIPFEMMAAGLPVVELYRENNLYDFPEGGIELAEASPEAVASTIINLLDDNEKRSTMSKIGLSYMKDYPLEKGFVQFVEAVDNIFNDTIPKKIKIDKTYNNTPNCPSQEILEKTKEILKVSYPIDSRGDRWKKIRRIRRKFKDILHAITRRIDVLIEKL